MHARVHLVSSVTLLLAVACGGGSDDEATGAGQGAGGSAGSSTAGASGSGTSGFPGKGGAGSGGGTAGSSTAGSAGSAGSATAGSGTAGSGTAGSGTAGSGTAGSGTAGSGTAGSGTAGSGTAGSATAGSGTAGSGTAGSGTGGCPTNGSPPGPAVKRFDVATLNCGASGVCSGTEDKCFCAPDFDALDGSPPHFMAVGTDQHKQKIWAAGNFQAVYVDDLNTNWQAGGDARADALMADAQAAFPCGVPEYFVLNEISAGLWPSDAAYRQFVVDTADALKNKHGKTPIVAAPFAKPGANGASWAALAKVAFVGAEVYLSGKEVNANGNSVTWCQDQYQAAIDAYGNLGVPKTKLYLFEHFGHSDGTVGWGRAGVSFAGWKNAVTARSKAIKNLGFAGFVSYAWAGNQMHATPAERLEIVQLYEQADLP